MTCRQKASGTWLDTAIVSTASKDKLRIKPQQNLYQSEVQCVRHVVLKTLVLGHCCSETQVCLLICIRATPCLCCRALCCACVVCQMHSCILVCSLQAVKELRHNFPYISNCSGGIESVDLKDMLSCMVGKLRRWSCQQCTLQCGKTAHLLQQQQTLIQYC